MSNTNSAQQPDGTEYGEKRSRTISKSGSLANIFGGGGEAFHAGSTIALLPDSSVGPILIANRGEIAIRIIRASHSLGLKAISIYSFEDRLSMHRYKADESFLLAEQGEMTPVGSYLAIERIISIAKQRAVATIHPGYGFLAENAEFARRCEEEGIHFVGPSPEVIEACGDKTKARLLAFKAKVPIVPGSEAITSFEQAKKFIDEYGFPIIIKAAFGGGGRGMRVVRDLESFQSNFERATSEALTAFGNGTVFIERFLERPRHIEVQILADKFGNVVHLFERDCSVQRRHQKVVEMGPAMNMPESVRQAILKDAVTLAKSCGYSNAGTAEFLLDRENRHYFIEINPRIQVEHTVTEQLTGIDIVSAQIQIALGASLESLGLTQSAISCRGVAIQCRITTEDASRNFQPDTGRIELYRSPAGEGVRLDGGPGFSGAVISPHYDSLLVKCTVLGRDFERTRRKMLCALSEFRVRGLKTNISFVTKLLSHPTFVEGGKVWTTFIDDTPSLFQNSGSANRGQKLLRYLGELAVNGSNVVGQTGLPLLKTDLIIPKFIGLTPEQISQPCKEGWRYILIEKGPAEFVKAIRAHKGLLLMDTTWRDAHQSLLATRVRTIDIARIATATSHAFKGLFALECWGGATFDVCLRFLSECPWERLKTLRALVPNIPFQMLLRGANAVGYTSYPDNLVYEFCKKAKECGVDVFRVFDSLNYSENMLLGIDAVKKAGGVVEAAIAYTGDVSDPSRTHYNLEYYLDLTKMLVASGIHILCIKDMAGLLKPKAATILISSIRKLFPDLVIHVHTHDTAGSGVAAMIACAEAGADIVDAAIDSLSGLTSQPCLGAIVSAFSGTSLDALIDENHIYSLNSYWEQVRLLYSPFDPNVKSSDSTVYQHEMPGGQYTNLLFQSQQLGLGEQWVEIKKKYIIANRLCGDITKVTPSSKVVGDFAQFMVAQKLSEQDVIERADSLSFPQSVIEYFQGYLGQPPYGFFEPLRTKVLNARRLEKVVGRPGKSMPPMDLKQLETDLQEEWGLYEIKAEDVLSAALYPAVFSAYRSKLDLYGDLSSLPTRYFLTPLTTGQEFTFDLEKGKTLIVKLVAIGPLNEDSGMRDVYFLLNGEARLVSIVDTVVKANVAGNGKALTFRAKADPKNKGQVAAPMSGVVVEIRVKVGTIVKTGDPLAIMSAMKMESVITATMAGKIESIAVNANESLSSGDLIATIMKE